jgi:hypothetical protein
MARATCRCGQILNVPDEGPGRIVCPGCGARVKLRRPEGAGEPADGFLRFFCPCGRRLKVSAERPPSHGKCPDCGRVVPVPSTSSPVGLPVGHPETPTEDLSPADLAALDRWARDHLARAGNAEMLPSTTDLSTRPVAPETGRAEVGLRVCPTCGRPVHLGAEVCRYCNTPVPRR